MYVVKDIFHLDIWPNVSLLYVVPFKFYSLQMRCYSFCTMYYIVYKTLHIIYCIFGVMFYVSPFRRMLY